jgi:uncharacterized iron-regulated membrane protein
LAASIDGCNRWFIHFRDGATGVLLAFERQIVGFVDRDVRFVSVPSGSASLPVNHLLGMVRQSGIGEPTAIVLRNEPRASAQFSIGRGKTVYVDPYSGAVLGSSSARAHEFFFAVERFHRALGSPLGSKTIGHWLAAASNLLFGGLILLGVILWLPRKRNGKAIRAAIAFRSGLRGKAREWNWHNVLGIWCALPLLVIVLSGVVMSYPWAALLFRMADGLAPAGRGLEGGREGGDRRTHGREGAAVRQDPDYDHLFAVAKTFDPAWRTITLNISRNANAPVSASVDTGSGGQPQLRTQYVLNRDTGSVVKKNAFGDGSLGQRLRAFVRFGHTGEYGGLPGQAIAALASFAACALVYTELSLSIRRLAARLRSSRRVRDSYAECQATESRPPVSVS